MPSGRIGKTCFFRQRKSRVFLTRLLKLVSATAMIPHLLSDSELLSLQLHRYKIFTPRIFNIAYSVIFFKSFL